MTPSPPPPFMSSTEMHKLPLFSELPFLLTPINQSHTASDYFLFPSLSLCLRVRDHDKTHAMTSHDAFLCNFLPRARFLPPPHPPPPQPKRDCKRNRRHNFL